MRKIRFAITAASFVLGAASAHYADCRYVQSVLRSDDLSLTRNVEQANALLDIDEQIMSEELKQRAIDLIPRDQNGVEVYQATRFESLVEWLDQRPIDLVSGR